MSDMPPLPERTRSFLCTKCGHNGFTDAQPPHAQCPKCTYFGFVSENDFTADQMHAYARAYAEQETATLRDDATILREHLSQAIKNVAALRERAEAAESMLDVIKHALSGKMRAAIDAARAALTQKPV